MNTADRSVALIDAAMRRRFHFVPFFPSRPPINDLLGKWLEKHESEAGWIADFLAFVNDELTKELGGDHLQIGPSHFMKKGIDEEMLERIWKYNVHPFIEDQLFGEPARSARFEYAAAVARYRSSIVVDTDPEPEPETASD